MLDYRKYFAPKNREVISVFRRARTDYAQVWLCVNWDDGEGHFYTSKEEMLYHGRAEACFKFVYDNLCGLENPEKAYSGDYERLKLYIESKCS